MEEKTASPPPANDAAPQADEIVSLVNRARDAAAALDRIVSEVDSQRAAVTEAAEQVRAVVAIAQTKSNEMDTAIETARLRLSEFESEVSTIRGNLAQSGSDGVANAQAKLAELETIIVSARGKHDEAVAEANGRAEAGLALIQTALQQSNERRDEIAAASSTANEELGRAQQLINEIQVVRAEVDANNQVIAQAAAAKQSLDEEAAAILERYQASLADAEERKAEFQASYEAAKADVENLTAQAETMLFGATNAGIASTFKEEVAALDKRIVDAERMFLFGIVTIGVSLIPLIMYMFNVSVGHDLTIESVLARTALLVPSVWLTRHFARRIHANFELRQQYVHKYSMGAIVEPFRRQAGEHASNVVAGVADQLMKNPASVLKRHQKMGDGPTDDMSEVLRPVTRLLPTPDRTGQTN